MRYHHLEGATQKRSSKMRWPVSLLLLGLVVGAYVTVNVNAPLLQGIDGRSPEATAQKLLSAKPGSDGNRLYIPQINVDIPIVEGEDRAALERGALHRNADINPATGGAFVLGARDLRAGATPAETKARSPFYHLDKLQPGDELFVDWGGKRYVYEVKKRVMVEGMASLTEAALTEQDPILTLYVADDTGNLGRDVAVRAEKVGTVAWGKKPVIQRGSDTN